MKDQDRKLMQQELEALENGDVPTPENVGKSLDAITALRERLAQPLRTHWEGCEEVHPECKMPEQEPVAWLYEAGNDRTLHWYKPLLYGTPLYTSPPQRKPLTKESLLYIFNQLPNWGMDMDSLPQGLEKLARAVEAAHGIKEGT